MIFYVEMTSMFSTRLPLNQDFNQNNKLKEEVPYRTQMNPYEKSVDSADIQCLNVSRHVLRVRTSAASNLSAKKIVKNCTNLKQSLIKSSQNVRAHKQIYTRTYEKNYLIQCFSATGLRFLRSFG
jgi:hypothetical protein